MRAQDFMLLEYDHDKTFLNLSSRILDRLRSEWEKDGYDDTVTPTHVRNVIEQAEAADPTAKKAFVLDLLRMYLDGSMARIEDVFKATEPLRLYSKFKNRGLPSTKTMPFSELLALGDALSDVMSKSEAGQAEEQAFYDRGDAYLAADNTAYKVVVPFNEEAAKFFGRGTRWCTAAENNNMFRTYCSDINKLDSRLWIVIFKGQSGKKWQIHLRSGQFMDSRDEDILPEDWFAEKDFVDWFVKKVMRAYMPTHYFRLLKYFPDPDSLPETLKGKIVSESLAAITYFKVISDEMIADIVEMNEPDRIRYIYDDIDESVAERLQRETISHYGLWAAKPSEITDGNWQWYRDFVQQKLSRLSSGAAYNTAYNLPAVAQFALRNNLCGPHKDRMKEGVEAALS